MWAARFERLNWKWFNAGLNTVATSGGVLPGLFGAFPSLAYDSWVAIGAANASETPAGGDYFSVWGSIDPTDQFAANGSDDFEGKNITVDDAIGGAWYCSFPWCLR